MPVQTSIAIKIDAPLAHTFDVAASMDPRDLIHAQGLLPGVAEIEGAMEPWRTPGQQRKMHLTDKSFVEEELVAFTRDSTFAYRVKILKGAFRALVREARGEWHFTKVGAEKTQIDWTYFFVPNGPVAEPLLWFVVKSFWPGYLRAALIRVKARAEEYGNENSKL